MCWTCIFVIIDNEQTMYGLYMYGHTKSMPTKWTSFFSSNDSCDRSEPTLIDGIRIEMLLLLFIDMFNSIIKWAHFIMNSFVRLFVCVLPLANNHQTNRCLIGTIGNCIKLFKPILSIVQRWLIKTLEKQKIEYFR